MKQAVLAALALWFATAAAAQPVVIDKAVYEDRLRGMWLGEAIANWTGLRTEGVRNEPPFLTDADWGTNQGRGPIEFVLGQDPWGADDDTDIEYVYLHLLDAHGASTLTGAQIAEGWAEHINRFIWVSNARARELIGRGVLPPATGLAAANQFWLRIDAQLTTEFFGALCPRMPGAALEMADLPIRTTSGGYASHASQYFALLYSLAAAADGSLSPEERVLWLVREARRYIPDESKTADAVDVVLADYLSNPDKDDWERTRDLICERYQLQAASHGFRYRGFTESTVNFATGVMALLYGGGDYRRTVQIGTLSGWDSDNPTATMGGLLGLMLGRDGVEAQFPGVNLSDRFWIGRTRDALPDWTPGDPGAEDTFALMAARMMPIVERRVLEAGGGVSADGKAWVLPERPAARPRDLNPLEHERYRSANVRVRESGGVVSCVSSAGPSSPPAPASVYGLGVVSRIGNGFEADFSGREPENDGDRVFYSSQGAAVGTGQPITLTVTYDRTAPVWTVRFVEGDHFNEAAADGGWFEAMEVEVRVDGVWVAAAGTFSEGLDASRPFQIIDYVLATPADVTGVRLRGTPGGAGRFVTCAELDAIAPAYCAADMDRNGRLGVSDFTALRAAYLGGSSAADFDGDGLLTVADFTAFRETYLDGCQ